VPVAAAVGGVIVAALIYTAFTAGAGGGAVTGWALPSATDIAFALAVLAVAGRHMPTALRTFLLTLAVVDNLLAIVILAVFYTSSLPLLAAMAPLAVFAVLVRRDPGLVAAAAAGRRNLNPGARLGRARNRRRRAAGPHRASSGQLPLWWPWRRARAGITAATWLVARFTRASLHEGLSWTDVLGLALLDGIGFTVWLLICELAFGPSGAREADVKVAVLTGSLIAALLATTVLRLRNWVYQRLEAVESADADHDDMPKVYERETG
jgi:NhaA family Na+:H+ antiporter